ncbi:hypothetical protein GCM10020218_076140 [Dactylosporangium vinaceum]
MLLSVLVAILVHVLGSRRAKAMELVEEATRDLRQAGAAAHDLAARLAPGPGRSARRRPAANSRDSTPATTKFTTWTQPAGPSARELTGWRIGS